MICNKSCTQLCIYGNTVYRLELFRVILYILHIVDERIHITFARVTLRAYRACYVCTLSSQSRLVCAFRVHLRGNAGHIFIVGSFDLQL